ncbi:MAG: hypothetical protein MZW92_40060 [Comamonadaceae bacterium]|nr:hypothetical protein [Comamonadaceae bacterium]
MGMDCSTCLLDGGRRSADARRVAPDGRCMAAAALREGWPIAHHAHPRPSPADEPRARARRLCTSAVAAVRLRRPVRQVARPGAGWLIVFGRTAVAAASLCPRCAGGGPARARAGSAPALARQRRRARRALGDVSSRRSRSSTIAIGLLGFASFPLFVLLLERALLGRAGWHAARGWRRRRWCVGRTGRCSCPRSRWAERTVQGLLWGIVSGLHVRAARGAQPPPRRARVRPPPSRCGRTRCRGARAGAAGRAARAPATAAALDRREAALLLVLRRRLHGARAHAVHRQPARACRRTRRASSRRSSRSTASRSRYCCSGASRRTGAPDARAYRSLARGAA